MKIEIGRGASNQAKDIERIRTALGRPRNFENFIDAYLRFTENQESTRKIHKWVAISILAAAMERKCFYNAGHFKVFPNLYIFVIGESGVVRKSTSTGIGVDLLRDIGAVRIMSERVTSASLIQQLERAGATFAIGDKEERQSSVFAYASELVVFLREVYGSISELLTTFYDCSPQDSSKPWVYETKGEGEIKIHGPCLNILGASTSAWLAKAIPSDEMEGGFSSRVIFVVEKENPDKFIAWPELRPEVEAMRPKLIQDLEQINALRGYFKKTQAAHEFYEQWYIDYKTRAIKEADARFKGYYGRKPTTVLKLAMILSVSEGNSLEFDQRHIEEAIELLEDLEANMLDAFGATGTNKLAPGIFKLTEVLKIRRTLTHKQMLQLLWREFSGVEINAICEDMVRMGIMKVSQAGGKEIHYHYLEPTQ